MKGTCHGVGEFSWLETAGSPAYMDAGSMLTIGIQRVCETDSVGIHDLTCRRERPTGLPDLHLTREHRILLRRNQETLAEQNVRVHA
jgi:hypothetical protein